MLLIVKCSVRFGKLDQTYPWQFTANDLVFSGVVGKGGGVAHECGLSEQSLFMSLLETFNGWVGDDEKWFHTASLSVIQTEGCINGSKIVIKRLVEA
jgi:hypothetical protein